MNRDEALKALLLELQRTCGEDPWCRFARADMAEIYTALSSPYGEPIRIVRLHFDRHVEGHFFFNDYICLPKDAAPEGVNNLTTLAYIVEEGRDDESQSAILY